LRAVTPVAVTRAAWFARIRSLSRCGCVSWFVARFVEWGWRCPVVLARPAIVAAVVSVTSVATALLAGFAIGGVAFGVSGNVARIVVALIAAIARFIALVGTALAAISVTSFTTVIALSAFLPGVVTVNAILGYFNVSTYDFSVGVKAFTLVGVLAFSTLTATPTAPTAGITTFRATICATFGSSVGTALSSPFVTRTATFAIATITA
jgi:hypothetical protein